MFGGCGPGHIDSRGRRQMPIHDEALAPQRLLGSSQVFDGALTDVPNALSGTGAVRSPRAVPLRIAGAPPDPNRHLAEIPKNFHPRYHTQLVLRICYAVRAALRG
jgi:hypothetical protein